MGKTVNTYMNNEDLTLLENLCQKYSIPEPSRVIKLALKHLAKK